MGTVQRTHEPGYLVLPLVQGYDVLEIICSRLRQVLVVVDLKNNDVKAITSLFCMYSRHLVVVTKGGGGNAQCQYL